MVDGDCGFELLMPKGRQSDDVEKAHIHHTDFKPILDSDESSGTQSAWRVHSCNGSQAVQAI